MSLIRHLDPADYKTVPWKNGGGSTTELWVEPAGASLADPFTWRLSLATLQGSGPFSPFPGIDRIIVQTAGKPMTLVHSAGGRETEHALSPLVPYRFRGEWTTAGRLEGQAQDFNVMVRRDQVAAHVEVLHLAPGERLAARRGANRLVAHVLSGSLACAGGKDGAAFDTFIASSGGSATTTDARLDLTARTAATIILVMVCFAT